MLAAAMFVWGLIIGSFLNVCIYRLPEGLSVVNPPSRCGACGTRLGVPDLVPVLSYVFLRGKCRHCGTAFSPRYALVELMTGVLFAGCAAVIDLSPALASAVILSAFLVVVTFIDIDHQLILDKVLIWMAGFGVVSTAALTLTGSRPEMVGLATGFGDMLTGALAGGGLMFLIAVISRGGMGGGDIKFAAALGFWLGLEMTLLTLFISFIVGGIGGGLAMVIGRKGRKDYIPFGPFIALGAYIALLYGPGLLKWFFLR